MYEIPCIDNGSIGQHVSRDVGALVDQQFCIDLANDVARGKTAVAPGRETTAEKEVIQSIFCLISTSSFSWSTVNRRMPSANFSVAIAS